MLTVYKASAGSGKTFTLTRDYIRILLGIQNAGNADQYHLNHKNHCRSGQTEHNRHRGILAITFTNKATEEMKKRILSELGKLKGNYPEGHPERCDFAGYLKDIYGCTDNELAETAGRALGELLHDGSNFHVSTIDSFFQQVLRSMAFELDYPGDYNIELDGKSVVSEAINMMLDDYNRGIVDPKARSIREDKTMKSILSEFMREEMANGKNFNIFNRSVQVHRDLVDKANSIFDEKYQQVSDIIEPWLYTDGAVDLFRNELHRQDTVLKQAVIGHIDSFYSNLAADGLVPADDVRGDYLNIAEKLRSGNIQPEALYGTRKAALILASEVPAKDRYNGFYLAKTAKLRESDNVSRFTDRILEAFKANSHRAAIALALKELRVYRFMRYVKDNIERYRRENNIIVLADTNELLRRIMEGEDKVVVPFVYEKMGVRLHHFLIDEFQDTSRMQWHNLKPLLQNGLGEGMYSMIIGDEKQAIYRFRNSDSSMLRNEVHEIDFPGLSTVKGSGPGENTNWRSAADIVRFNNTLFRAISEKFNIPDYSNVNQEITASKTGLSAYIRFYQCDVTESDNLGLAENSVDFTDADEDASPLEKQNRLMVDEIRRQHEAGYKWSDIAILVNTNDNAVDVASLLLSTPIDPDGKKGISPTIPVTTDEALLLMFSPAVNFIISTMEMMLDARDFKKGRAQEQAMTPPDPKTATRRFNYFLNHELSEKGSENEAVISALRKAFANDSDSAGSGVDDIVNMNSSTLVTLVEDIIARRINPETRRLEMAYIAAFEDCVMQYSLTHNNSLPDFLRWWEANKRKLTIASPENIDALRIMTIHKSKGLEFQCVHIPFAGYNLAGSPTKSESLWIPLPDFMKNPNVYMPDYVRVTMTKEASLPFSPLRDAYLRNMTERIIDGLNKTYVAYTRATRELCVYYIPRNASRNGTELGELLPACFSETTATVKPNEIALAEHFDGRDLCIGEPTLPEVKKKKHSGKECRTVRLTDYTMNPSVAETLTSVDALFTFENEDDSDMDPDFA